MHPSKLLTALALSANSTSSVAPALTAPAGPQRGPITFFRPSILRRAGRVISGYRAGKHAPGSVIKFRSGSRYEVGETGQITNIYRRDEKPWSNKAEHKAWKRSRRMSRNLALAS